MATILDFIVIPASLVLVLGLGFWSFRGHGRVFALDGHPAIWAVASVVMVLSVAAQLLVPMRYKDIAQPLLVVAFLWVGGALIIAGLVQRRGGAR